MTQSHSILPKLNRNQRTVPYVLLFPSMLFVLVILGFPLLYSLVHSIQYSGQFVGIKNYLEILSDEAIIDAILRTFLFVVICSTVELILGFSYALLLNRRFPLRGFVRTLFLLPLLFPPVVGALNWGFLLNNDFGAVNQLLRYIPGINPPLWLSNPSLAFISVSIATIWRNTPFVTILLLAGLQAISNELYESAKIDGASKIQMFFFVTIPSMQYVILITVMLRIIDLFRVFDTIYVMTQGGPGCATEIISTKIFKFAFWDVNPGYACALSYIALLVTLILLIPLLVFSSKRSDL